jgi:hypothetical protein
LSGEKTVVTNDRRGLARRFFARIGYAYLIGMSTAVFGIVFDLIFSPDRKFTTLIGGAAGALAMMLILNTGSIAILTFMAHQHTNARPPWWVLPAIMGLLVGLLLVVLYLVGITQAYAGETSGFVVENELNAFVVGAVAGLAVGTAYTLSIPGIRHDTLMRQAQRSIIIGGVIGIQYGAYWLLRELSQGRPIQIYNMLASTIAVPVYVISLLLSFVIGIELGDRYVER